MKAILDQDRIISVSSTGSGVEIGPLPVGVGLERLRWNGKAVIDLINLSDIYVDTRLELHCIEVTGSQLIKMTYGDRKNLAIEDGVIRLKTAEEIAVGLIQAGNSMLKTRLRSSLKGKIGDTPDNVADLNKLVYVILESMVGGSADATAFLGELLLILRETYSYAGSKDTLLANAPILQDEMSTYYGSIQPELPP